MTRQEYTAHLYLVDAEAYGAYRSALLVAVVSSDPMTDALEALAEYRKVTTHDRATCPTCKGRASQRRAQKSSRARREILKDINGHAGRA
jgi:hypothetical protein